MVEFRFMEKNDITGTRESQIYQMCLRGIGNIKASPTLQGRAGEALYLVLLL
jgi:hypothetical protein